MWPATSTAETAWIGVPAASVYGVRMTPIDRNSTIESVVDGDDDLGRLDDRGDDLAGGQPERTGGFSGDSRDDLPSGVQSDDHLGHHRPLGDRHHGPAELIARADLHGISIVRGPSGPSSRHAV